MPTLFAANTIERQAAEIARLRLDVEQQEALHVSSYRAGMMAGWNFCVDGSDEAFQQAMAGTEHIRELLRIRDARQTLKETTHD